MSNGDMEFEQKQEEVEEEIILPSEVEKRGDPETSEGDEPSGGKETDEGQTTDQGLPTSAPLQLEADPFKDMEHQLNTTQEFEQASTTSNENEYKTTAGLEPVEESCIVPTVKPTTPARTNVRFEELPQELTPSTRSTAPAVNEITNVLDNTTLGEQNLIDKTSQLASLRRTNPPQSSIYQRPARQPNMETKFTHGQPQPTPNVYYTPHWSTKQEITPSMPRRVEPTAQISSPIRRTSTSSNPYIGSQAISAETGPSLTVFLRRPTSERPWGFTFYGGSEYGCPPFVNKVAKNSLAFQHGVEVGDVIVSICKSLTVGKTQEQLKAEMLRAGNELDLVLIRRGIDLGKISQLAPQALQSPVRSPPPGVSTSHTEFRFSEEAISPPRIRNFRPVRTKCLRLLEEQLNAGQVTASTMAKRMQLQVTRGGVGSTTTFTNAYGQDRNRAVFSPTPSSRSTATYWYEPPRSPQSIRPMESPYQYSTNPPPPSQYWQQKSHNVQGYWSSHSNTSAQQGAPFGVQSMPGYGIQQQQFQQNFATPSQPAYSPQVITSSVQLPISDPSFQPYGQTWPPY